MGVLVSYCLCQNYYRFNDLKQHKCIILLLWRPEVDVNGLKLRGWQAVFILGAPGWNRAFENLDFLAHGPFHLSSQQRQVELLSH